MPGRTLAERDPSPAGRFQPHPGVNAALEWNSEKDTDHHRQNSFVEWSGPFVTSTPPLNLPTPSNIPIDWSEAGPRVNFGERLKSVAGCQGPIYLQQGIERGLATRRVRSGPPIRAEVCVRGNTRGCSEIG
jgi:hypothetical protein